MLQTKQNKLFVVIFVNFYKRNTSNSNTEAIVILGKCHSKTVFKTAFNILQKVRKLTANSNIIISVCESEQISKLSVNNHFFLPFFFLLIIE